ncbi:MAG: type I secretion C-terminal target domain-containing protein, partial [Aeromonas sp.]
VTIVDDGDNNGILSKAEIGADQILVKALVDHTDLLAGSQVTLTINNGGSERTVELKLVNGVLQLTDGQPATDFSYNNGTISWTEIAPADSKSLIVEATQIDLAGNRSEQDSDSAQVVIADTPILSVNKYAKVAALDFEDINLGNREWRADVDINSVSGSGVIGQWYANGTKQIEVGKESVYISGGDKDNQVLEIEGNNGVNQIYTVLGCEAGRFYQLEFDIGARKGFSPSTCGLTISLIKLDASGNEVPGSSRLLYDFSPTKAGWLKGQLTGFEIDEASNYKLLFESKDVGDSVGAVLDNIAFQAVDNKGYTDNYIKLGKVNAALTDTDGSETLKVLISGAPVGAELTDGTHSVIFKAGEKLDITSWNLATLQMKTDIAGNHKLTIEAVATEGATQESVSSSKDFIVTVLPKASPISLTVDDDELSPVMAQISEDEILLSASNSADGSQSAQGERSHLSRGFSGFGDHILDNAEEINLFALAQQAPVAEHDRYPLTGVINDSHDDLVGLNDLLDDDNNPQQGDISHLLEVFEKSEKEQQHSKESDASSATHAADAGRDNLNNLSGGMGSVTNQTLDYLLNTHMLEIDK